MQLNVMVCQCWWSIDRPGTQLGPIVLLSILTCVRHLPWWFWGRYSMSNNTDFNEILWNISDLNSSSDRNLFFLLIFNRRVQSSVLHLILKVKDKQLLVVDVVKVIFVIITWFHQKQHKNQQLLQYRQYRQHLNIVSQLLGLYWTCPENPEICPRPDLILIWCYLYTLRVFQKNMLKNFVTPPSSWALTYFLTFVLVLDKVQHFPPNVGKKQYYVANYLQ